MNRFTNTVILTNFQFIQNANIWNKVCYIVHPNIVVVTLSSCNFLHGVQNICYCYFDLLLLTFIELIVIEKVRRMS